MPAPAARSTPIVDIHCHILTPRCEALAEPAFSAAKDPFFRYSTPASDEVNDAQMRERRPRFIDPEVRIADMDAMGVDIQAIAVAPPQYYYWADSTLGAELAATHNDHIASIVERYPDRFRGLATLPMQDVDAALAEMRRAVDLGFRGIEIGTNVGGSDLDDERFLPLFQEACERSMLIVAHPHGFSHGERLTDHYLINTVGMPLDSTVFLSHLIFGGVLERFPELRLCVVHGGGYLPFYPARFDHAYRVRPELAAAIPRPPSEYLHRLYFDTMVFDPSLLAILIQRYGPGRVLLGTDYPFDMGETDPLGLIDSVDGLDDAERAAISGGNAAELLGITT
jgi:aminocarboxymuconate-semialdehyde decarboxylase